MKRSMKTVFTAVSAVILSLCLTFGAVSAIPAQAITRGSSGSSSSEESSDAGYYTLIAIAYTDSDDFTLEYTEEELADYGMAGCLVLYEDGSGVIFIADEGTELTWKDGSMEIEGEEVSYTVEDGILLIEMEEDGESMSITFRFEDAEAPSYEELAAMMSANYDDGEEDIDFDFDDFDSEDDDVIIVSNVEELMESIDDDVTIILLPGTYNVTEWLETADLPEWDEDNFEDEYYPWDIYSREVFDGKEVIISNYDYVTLMSADKNDPAVITCDPRYANVLTFCDCDNLVLDHIVFGHSDSDGSCTGNVLSLIYSWTVTITDCDIYGCGAYGLYVQDCNELEVNDSLIHDCTYGCAIFDNSSIKLKYVEFYDCKEFTMFEVSDTTADFTGCIFDNLDGEFISIFDDDSEVNLILCEFDDAALDSIEANEAYDVNLFVY